jgi:hypothetical protein
MLIEGAALTAGLGARFFEPQSVRELLRAVATNLHAAPAARTGSGAIDEFFYVCFCPVL